MIELILSNANCSKELLTKYSKYDCFSHIVAKNPNCPLDILEELFIKNDPYDKKYIAMNPNCPLDILDKLADEEDAQIIVEVAKNSNTSSKTLDKLIDNILNSNFHYASIVYHIINNPNLSASSLKRLMDNGYKKEAASKSNISRDIIEKLMVDSNSIIREKFAINPMALESEISDDGNHASLNYRHFTENILHRNSLIDIEDIEYSILNIDCPISTSLFSTMKGIVSDIVFSGTNSISLIFFISMPSSLATSFTVSTTFSTTGATASATSSLLSSETLAKSLIIFVISNETVFENSSSDGSSATSGVSSLAVSSGITVFSFKNVY